MRNDPRLDDDLAGWRQHRVPDRVAAAWDVVGPGEVDVAGAVQRDRREMGQQTLCCRDLDLVELALLLVEGARGVRQDRDADGTAAVVDDRLDERSVDAVVVELAESREPVAVVTDAEGATGRAAIAGAVDGVAVGGVARVGREEDLVLVRRSEPWPVTLVAVDGAFVPGAATVARGEERVVHEVDAGVVDTTAVVLGQVGVGEAAVDGRVGLEAGAGQVDGCPVPAVARGPDVDLVAVVGGERRGFAHTLDQAVVQRVRGALVRGVDVGLVPAVVEDDRLAAGQLLVDVERLSEIYPTSARGP